MPVILVTQEVEIGESQAEEGPGKSMRPQSEKKSLKAKGLWWCDSSGRMLA
jgi:hypothetical protein